MKESAKLVSHITKIDEDPAAPVNKASNILKTKFQITNLKTAFCCYLIG
jgi:hypothetical protein